MPDPPNSFVIAIDPLLLPLHTVTSVGVTVPLNTNGSVIVWLTVAVQLSASLIVTVYVAAARLVKVWLFVPKKFVPSMEYSKGEVPPEPITEIVPSVSPLHKLLLEEETLTANWLAG